MAFTKANLQQAATLQFEYQLAHEAANHHLYGVDESGIQISDEAMVDLINQGVVNLADVKYQKTGTGNGKKCTFRYGGTNLFCFIWAKNLEEVRDGLKSKGRI